MTKSHVSSGALQCRSWTVVWFGRSLFLLLLGNIVGSWGESGSWREAASSSSDEQSLLQNSFTTVLPSLLQIQHDNNVTENNVRRTRRSSASASSEDSTVLPPSILTASHLSSLRDLVSDKKITVRLGLRVTLSGPSELLDTQLPLLLSNKSGLYNTGQKSGLFSMRIVGIKKVTSTP